MEKLDFTFSSIFCSYFGNLTFYYNKDVPLYNCNRRATRNFRGQGSNPQKRAHRNFFNENIALDNIFQI